MLAGSSTDPSSRCGVPGFAYAGPVRTLTTDVSDKVVSSQGRIRPYLCEVSMGQSTHAPLPRSLPWLAGKCPLAARASRRQTRRGGPQGADRQAEALRPGDRPKKPPIRGTKSSLTIDLFPSTFRAGSRAVRGGEAPARRPGLERNASAT